MIAFADLETYEFSEADEPPELTNGHEIARYLSENYPAPLRELGVVGTLTVRMLVREDGTVDPRSVSIENSTHDAFSDAARRTVEQMRFRPAKVDDAAVNVWVTLPIAFQLESS